MALRPRIMSKASHHGGHHSLFALTGPLPRWTQKVAKVGAAAAQPNAHLWLHPSSLARAQVEDHHPALALVRRAPLSAHRRKRHQRADGRSSSKLPQHFTKLHLSQSTKRNNGLWGDRKRSGGRSNKSRDKIEKESFKIRNMIFKIRKRIFKIRKRIFKIRRRRCKIGNGICKIGKRSFMMRKRRFKIRRRSFNASSSEIVKIGFKTGKRSFNASSFMIEKNSFKIGERKFNGSSFKIEKISFKIGRRSFNVSSFKIQKISFKTGRRSFNASRFKIEEERCTIRKKRFNTKINFMIRIMGSRTRTISSRTKMTSANGDMRRNDKVSVMIVLQSTMKEN